MVEQKILCVIPARGGSKGIPRKNVRPLAGKPLIYYSIKECLDTPGIDTVVVSTDDEEIAYLAKQFGAQVLMRPEDLADDITPLDPVIVHALRWSEQHHATVFDVIITVQPTSPLIGRKDLSRAIEELSTGKIDTLLSVVDDRHLCWTLRDGVPAPEYAKRVNRQLLPARYRETGAIIGCLRKVLLETDSRIGDKVGLLEVEQERSFDIDSISDFKLCENLMLRKRIIFNVIGNESIGMGHVYRQLMIANELVGHDLIFVCPDGDALASELIDHKNFPVTSCAPAELLNTILSLTPDMVINDILDTDQDFMASLKAEGIAVVNFEDLGTGIKQADLVINALYPAGNSPLNVKSGHEYFCLRDEFIHTEPPPDNQRMNDVLLCFGGVDEGNLTNKVLQSIYEDCRAEDFHITIVLGAGYQYRDLLDETLAKIGHEGIQVASKTSAIAGYMQRAKVAFTSGGRTVFELAALRTPSIVICQNDREMTHNFAFDNAGIINLGHRHAASVKDILSAFQHISRDSKTRENMRKELAAFDFGNGKKRVTDYIKRILDSRDD